MGDEDLATDDVVPSYMRQAYQTLLRRVSTGQGRIAKDCAN